MKRLFLLPLLVSSIASANAENWPGWRGPRGDGTCLEKNVPLHWSAHSNVVWKTELPGAGHASPIVWRDQVFLAAADGDNRILISLDRETGKIRWRKVVVTAPLEKKHSLNSHASSTPATDGTLVYVTFLDRGQMVVAAYDHAGHQRWLVRPGEFQSMHGFCSSPVLFQDKVIVNGDHDGDSYIVAISRNDGSTLWKTMRDNHTRSYCVPIILPLAGRTQMVLSGDKCVASFDPNDGSRHWVIQGPTEQFVASLVYNTSHDILFLTGGFPELHVLGIRPNGRGDVTQTHIAWRSNKGVSYVPSPISFGDYFFIVSDGGIASCFEAVSGRIRWQERLEGDHHASLISANGLIYFLSDAGRMTVVNAKPDFEIVARNDLDEKTFASPAISEGQIFLRSDKHLFCIQEPR
ncbi:MAG: PQQ-binding-like beta-propeller repeat protein [Verrucomicrobiales bacterium]|nr:PQQ-binding-like beta-propeller repeat protein [Verrucomicrobiales bacterium]